MSSPLDSRYLKSPQSPIRGPSISPERRLMLDSISKNEQDEITSLRIKISQMQSQQAERAHEYNEDCKNLELQVTNLRASVEKGEVLKQKLEYDLTLAKRSLNNERRKFAEQETNLQKSNSALKEKVVQFENEISDLKKQLVTETENRVGDVKKLQEMIISKENENTQIKQINKRLLEAEQRSKGNEQENEKLISNLQEKCRTLENQRDSQNDTVRRLMKDIEFSAGQEERLESELSRFKEKIKHYEDIVEAERSAHLETKFNFELLQVRVRDLEGTEASLKDCKQDLENHARDYRKLKNAMDDQLKAYNELKDLMEKKDQQHTIEISEMKTELKEKYEKERLLSEQLDLHQTNFNALKGELSEAKNHQTSIESSYGSNMKELEMILDNFRVEKSNDAGKIKEKPKKKKASSNALLEELRQTFREHQTRLVDANSRVETLKKANDQSTSDCQRLKQKLKEKEKAVEEAQSKLKNSHLESARFKAECVRYENELTKRDDDSNKLAKRFGDQKDRYHQIQLQMEELQDTLARTQETHEAFLCSIYQQLITGHPFIQSRKDNIVTSFSASELGHMIQEQLDSKMNELRVAEERVGKLENTMKDFMEDHEKLKHTHEESVKKASKRNKEKEAEWKRRMAELEENYRRIIDDIQKKTDKSKLTLDEAWARLDKTNKSKEELQMENARLQKSLSGATFERSCFLVATSLLSSSFSSASRQLQDLLTQRNMMKKMTKEVAYLKQQVIHLVDILKTEMEVENGNIRPKTRCSNRLPGILRFRRAVIVVLAANRLNYHSVCALQYLRVESTSSGVKSNDLIVLSCGKTKRKKFKGIYHRHHPARYDPHACLQLLTNQNLASVVTHSTKHLVEELSTNGLRIQETGPRYMDDSENEEQECNGYSKKPIRATGVNEEARNAYKKLLKGLQKEFPSSLYEPGISTSQYSETLANQLRFGLRKALVKMKDRGITDPYPTSSYLVDTMNGHFLGFIERLHAAELERKSLRQNLSRLKGGWEDMEKLLRSERELKSNLAEEETFLQRKLAKMKERMHDMVDADRYDSLCSDLNLALEREAKAQKLLEEYTKQLEDIEKRVEVHTMQEKSKDTAITETLTTLNNAKNEISKRDEMIKKLRNDVEFTEKEKVLVQRNLADLQKSFHSISREQEILMGYIRAVGTVLEQSRNQATLKSTDKFDFVLPELVLPDEVLTLDGIQMSKDMLACQDTVHMFYQSQRLALQEISRLCMEKQNLTQKIDILSEEVRAQRDSVMQIRGEMTALQVANASNKRVLPRFETSQFHSDEILTKKMPMKHAQNVQNMTMHSQNGFFPLMSSDKT